jgi:hypothetical protein
VLEERLREERERLVRAWSMTVINVRGDLSRSLAEVMTRAYNGGVVLAYVALDVNDGQGAEETLHRDAVVAAVTWASHRAGIGDPGIVQAGIRGCRQSLRRVYGRCFDPVERILLVRPRVQW